MIGTIIWIEIGQISWKQINELHTDLISLYTLVFVLKLGTRHYTGFYFQKRKPEGLKMGCFPQRFAFTIHCTCTKCPGV
jgi:hypothetical protein